jgi:uncharacterized membrane protein YeaQ/YmgE (transglycosylase-associated protein family)
MGGLLWTIVIGLVAGALAKLVMPGKDPGGILITIILGIGGALLATVLGRLTGWYAPDKGAGFIAATLGAIVILLIYRMIKGRKVAPKA